MQKNSPPSANLPRLYSRQSGWRIKDMVGDILWHGFTAQNRKYKPGHL